MKIFITTENNNRNKKVLNLKKETLVKLQEKALKTVMGAGGYIIGGPQTRDRTDGSCCKRSCHNGIV